MVYKLRRVTHAIWVYLNQPITFSQNSQSVWKFDRFFYLYKIRLLENCWRQDSFQSNHKNCGHDEYSTEN